ncbi:MAG: type IV pilus modification PilV family protein [Gemmatimonadota bacterium]
MSGSLVTGRGATLLEVMVSVFLLGVGGMALVGSIAHALRARERSVSTALAAIAAEAWIERWRGETWRGEGGGSTAIAWGARRGRLEWTLEDVGACLQEAQVKAVAGRGDEAVVVATRRFREGANGC